MAEEKKPSEAVEQEDAEEEAKDEEESDEDEEGEEEGEEGEEGSEGEEDDDEEASEGEQDVKPVARTPKVTTRKVMQVTTPGGGPRVSRKEAVTEIDVKSGKRRGRPTKADMVMRERDREEANSKGDPDIELKRTRRKPNKLADGVSSDEDDPKRRRG